MSTPTTARPVADKPMFPQLPNEDLQMALAMVTTAHGWLQEAYRLVEGHYTLRIQCETAGKSAKHLREMIAARTKGGV
ncbi:hypothetical protein ACOYR4_11325 [Acidovorax sp. M14]|jgi:hypothetical protein|uniref:hypothetical protein n=1 Tax=Acidovorax sp. M14 TaxID=3411354 RepID=UPI003BF46AF7